MSQYLVEFLSVFKTTGGHIIHPPLERLLPITGFEPTPFRNSASKVGGLQVHATTPIIYAITAAFMLFGIVSSIRNLTAPLQRIRSERNNMSKHF